MGCRKRLSSNRSESPIDPKVCLWTISDVSQRRDEALSTDFASSDRIFVEHDEVAFVGFLFGIQSASIQFGLY